MPFRNLYDEMNRKLMERIDLEVQRRAWDPRPITPVEWNEMYLNSWEREYLIPKFTDELVIQSANYCISNCHVTRGKPAVTYNDAAVLYWIPELIKRLKAKE